jgi:choline dehydrogenase-like flavoprotein
MADASSFDFIVVGSGAGGGVLAARLARNNRNLKVLLIEAGSDPQRSKHYGVPAFHALATEDPELRWGYFVEHFTDPALGRQDEKYREGKGIFYPRASAIGGCTAHHALITVYPDPSDWNVLPGPGREEQALRDFIMTRAWGHHDSCTCAIGDPADESAVLDGNFRVIGVPGQNLRVVDASAFPKIPGYFIVLPIYLIAEKAADVILKEHGAVTKPN